MSIQQQTHPGPLPTVSREEFRRKLAGLADPSEKRGPSFREDAKRVAVHFCSALPAVFSDELDRLKMWDKIAAAIHSAYAKTTAGDLDLFVQCVLESIKADAGKAVACQKLNESIEMMNAIPEDHRQDWLAFLVGRLIPVLAEARKLHKEAIGS